MMYARSKLTGMKYCIDEISWSKARLISEYGDLTVRLEFLDALFEVS